MPDFVAACLIWAILESLSAGVIYPSLPLLLVMAMTVIHTACRLGTH